MNANYWLFAPPPWRKRAIIHWHGCGYCNDGNGTQHADHTVTKWYPAGSVADAERQARVLGVAAFVRPCDRCGAAPMG